MSRTDTAVRIIPPLRPSGSQARSSAIAIDGRPRLHRPDLVVKGEDGFTVYELRRDVTPARRREGTWRRGA